MQISGLAIVPEELNVSRGGNAALLCPKQRGLRKDNVSRFSWGKVGCMLLADIEERDAQNSRNIPLMTLSN